MQIVPLIQTPNQSVSIALAGQQCTLNIYQKFFGLFMDVLVSNSLIIGGVLCLNANLIVRDLYLGMQGDFAFIDNQGSTDPNYTGLGGQTPQSRYSLVYLTAEEVAIQLGLSEAGVPTIAGATNPATVVTTPSSGTVTLIPGQTSQVVPASNCAPNTPVTITPLTADAAASITSTYVVPGNGFFTIFYANNTNADRSFMWEIG